MRIKKKNIARLASFSALSAGALGVAAGTAQAGILYSGPLNVTVGFRLGDVSTFFGGLHIAQGGTSNAGNRSVRFSFGGGAFKITGPYSMLRVFPAGVLWDPATNHSRSTGYVGRRLWGGRTCLDPEDTHCEAWGSRHSATPSSYQHQYALFTEGGGLNGPIYGWMELSLDVTNAPGLDPGGTLGPNVTVEGFAFDDSGAKIAAGDTGVPEPSTLPLTGLAALALGAAGLRRWRAARKLAA